MADEQSRLGKPVEPSGLGISTTEQSGSEVPGSETRKTRRSRSQTRLADARARSRAAADRTEAKAQKPETEISVENAEAVKPKRQPKAKQQKPAPQVEQVNGTESANMIMAMAELFVVAKFGKKAAFTPAERMFIEPALGRLIDRYGNTVQQLGPILDLAMVGIGGAVYLARLTQMVLHSESDDTPPDNPNKPPKPEVPDPGSNGAVSGPGIPTDVLFAATGGHHVR